MDQHISKRARLLADEVLMELEQEDDEPMMVGSDDEFDDIIYEEKERDEWGAIEIETAENTAYPHTTPLSHTPACLATQTLGSSHTTSLFYTSACSATQTLNSSQTTPLTHTPACSATHTPSRLGGPITVSPLTFTRVFSYSDAEPQARLCYNHTLPTWSC